jgi:transcriptional regulator with XRE-family HTH domain
MPGMEREKKIPMLLKKARKRPVDLATAGGVPAQRINEWMNGKHNPKPEVLVKIARALNTTVEFIYDDALHRDPEPCTDDERFVLRLFRNSGLTADVVAQILLRHAPKSVVFSGANVAGYEGAQNTNSGDSPPAASNDRPARID